MLAILKSLSSQSISTYKEGLHRVDLVAAVDLSGWTILQKLYPEEVNNFAAVDKPIMEALASIMFLKENTELITDFQKGLRIILGNGVYDTVLTDYYGSNEAKALAVPESMK